MKSAGQDKPRTRVPERWLQNPALSIGPDVLKPIVGGMSPCMPQVSLLQSSLGPVKAKHRLTQNPPVDLEPWIRAVQLPLLSPPFPKWISASTYHQQAQSRFGSTLHSHLLSSYIQILPTTWSALGPPSQQSIHRAHSSLQGEKPQIRVGEHLQEEERRDEGVGRRGGKEITFTARERSLS